MASESLSDREKREKREQLQKLADESKRLLAMTEAEAISLGPPTWYARMRAEREIEAHEWLQQVKREIIPERLNSAGHAPIGRQRRPGKTTPILWQKD